MKKSITSILLSLWLLLPLGGTAQGDTKLALKMVENYLAMNDTMSARVTLETISPQCEQSRDWNIRFHYYSLRGDLYSLYPKKKQLAIDDFQKAWDAYPDTVIPTQEFLTVTYSLSKLYLEEQHFRQSERIASSSLFRSLAILSECYTSARLFNLLARFYEQRGDGIMTSHFHRKSQELSVKYYLYVTVSHDSLDFHYKRLDMLYRNIDNTKRNFSKDEPEYMYLLDYLCSQITEANNIPEAIYLSELVLQTARDSMILESFDYCFNSYTNLLYAYSIDDNLDMALSLLPEAQKYYEHFPDINDADLYYEIGVGLYANNPEKYAKEINHFLQMAKAGLDEKSNGEQLKSINEILSVCAEQ